MILQNQRNASLTSTKMIFQVGRSSWLDLAEFKVDKYDDI